MEQEDGARVPIAYHRSAEDEVRDKSPFYCELLRGAASDPEVIGFLLTLPREKRQPNLFLAAPDTYSARLLVGISCEASVAGQGRWRRGLYRDGGGAASIDLERRSPLIVPSRT